MGIDDRLRAADTGVRHAAFVDAVGRTRASMRTRRAGASEIEIARADLAAAVLETVRPDVQLLFGDTVTALAQDADGVDVSFERSMGRRFDLVVGADGVHSATRRLAFGAGDRLRTTLRNGDRTVRTDIDIADPSSVLIYNEPGRMLAVHPAGGHPGAAFIFRTDLRVDRARSGGCEEAGRGRLCRCRVACAQPVGSLARGRRRVRGYGHAHGGSNLASWPHRIARRRSQPPLLLGEGSSNAIIGAHILASALESHGGDHIAAFSAYQQAHRGNVRHAQRGASIASRFLVPATAAGIRARNAVLRLPRASLRGRGGRTSGSLGCLESFVVGVEVPMRRWPGRSTEGTGPATN